MIRPRPRGGGFNDADLRYVRRALWALKDARKVSDQAAAWSTDPGVRALARRAGTMQADYIRELSSMLERWGHDEEGPENPGPLEGSSHRALVASSLSSLDATGRVVACTIWSPAKRRTFQPPSTTRAT